MVTSITIDAEEWPILVEELEIVDGYRAPGAVWKNVTTVEPHSHRIFNVHNTRDLRFHELRPDGKFA